MNLNEIGQIARSALLFPIRTYRSTVRMLDPNYRLQWQANWYVTRWLSKKRLRELVSVSGTSSERECVLLAHLVGISPQGGCVLEIGAFKGKSATMLVESAVHRKDKPTVVSVDPHEKTWDEFNKTCDRFKLKERGLEVHRCFSHELGINWTRPISFLWVDGGHEYEDVRQDIVDFIPHVMVGGWIAFDDANNGTFPGVERAITEWSSASGDFKRVSVIKNFQIFKRVGRKN